MVLSVGRWSGLSFLPRYPQHYAMRFYYAMHLCGVSFYDYAPSELLQMKECFWVTLFFPIASKYRTLGL